MSWQMAALLVLGALAVILAGAQWIRSSRTARVALLGEVARNHALRSRLYPADQSDRRKYTEMWFDIYRHELEFLLADQRRKPSAAKTLILAHLLRDRVEWFDRKFLDYIENIAGKFSRKGFLYPLVLDDFQELWCELNLLAEVLPRANLRTASIDAIVHARGLADSVTRRVGDRAGIKPQELRAIIQEIRDTLHSARSTFETTTGLLQPLVERPTPAATATAMATTATAWTLPSTPQELSPDERPPWSQPEANGLGSLDAVWSWQHHDNLHENINHQEDFSVEPAASDPPESEIEADPGHEKRPGSSLDDGA